MKKNLGSIPALYPVPIAVIGTMDKHSPTWTLAAHMGTIGHDRVLVSLAQAHYITGIIERSGSLSINLVNEDMLPQADYAGSVSGAKTSKADLFAYEPGAHGAPIISKSPLAIACTVADRYDTSGFVSYIGTIDATYVDEQYLNEQGKIDYHRLRPVLFEFPTYQYLRTGDIIGPCLSFKSSERI